jgi:hypothetical protein
MEQPKIVNAPLSQDDALETNDVRTLKDLEMVLVGGGSDDAVTW